MFRKLRVQGRSGQERSQGAEGAGGANGAPGVKDACGAKDASGRGRKRRKRRSCYSQIITKTLKNGVPRYAFPSPLVWKNVHIIIEKQNFEISKTNSSNIKLAILTIICKLGLKNSFF